MPSRQDQLHSYQFTVQRVVAALVMRETDPAQSPFRRAAGATMASVLIAVIALGGVVVYGLIVGGGSDKWRDTSAVIVEKETGARYVFREGKLHPVLNYASALLIIGSAAPKSVLVSAKSIEGVPRGAPLGIADAPDSLTPAKRLSAYPWTVCSGPVTGAGATGSRSVLVVGGVPRGGRPLGDEGVLLRQPDGGLHLLWHNRRHLIRDSRVVLSVLGATSRPKVAASLALINSLSAGADLAPMPVPGLSEAFDAVPDAKIGQVFVIKSQGGGEQYAVAMRGGLAGISLLQANLLLSDPETSAAIGQEKPTELSQADFARIDKLPDAVPAGVAPPAVSPKLADADGAVCAVIRGDSGAAEVLVGVPAPDVSDAVRTGSRTSEGAVLADYVMVEPGRGAVVEEVGAPGAAGTLSIVTSLGRRYEVANAGVLGILGYAGVKPVRLPTSVVTLLPAGRALDPDAARVPAVQG
ncbi:MAG TPA: type VII secretion protein EccB [Pilimelia sp.]|nr:type VII secretion protein EccB [Pilimelia sp.]